MIDTTIKSKFINCIQTEIFNKEEQYKVKYGRDWENIVLFWKSLINNDFLLSQEFTTEQGLNILIFMQKNFEKYDNSFSAKDVGEGIHVSAKSASGSLQKLTKDSFCERKGLNSICYGITQKGLDFLRIKY